MRLLWLDIETTGLSPIIDKILEVAFEITDENLNSIKKFHKIYPIRLGDLKWVSSYVIQMHTKNGLLKECQKAKEASMYEDFANFFTPLDKPHPIGFNPSFDISFIDQIFPISSYIHHRKIDLNSFILMDRIRGILDIKKEETEHRAALDLILAQKEYLKRK